MSDLQEKPVRLEVQGVAACGLGDVQQRLPLLLREKRGRPLAGIHRVPAQRSAERPHALLVLTGSWGLTKSLSS